MSLCHSLNVQMGNRLKIYVFNRVLNVFQNHIVILSLLNRALLFSCEWFPIKRSMLKLWPYFSCFKLISCLLCKKSLVLSLETVLNREKNSFNKMKLSDTFMDTFLNAKTCSYRHDCWNDLELNLFNFSLNVLHKLLSHDDLFWAIHL